MIVRKGWMDSTALSSELGNKPMNHIFATEQGCRDYHGCIQASEEYVEDHGCFSQQVVVMRQEDYEQLLKEATK